MTRYFCFTVGCLLLMSREAVGQTYDFPLPSDDRWQYPFNFTPGSRPTASCFGAPGLPGFNDRDGIVIVAWDTTTLIPPGRGQSNYLVEAVRVVLTNEPGAQWLVDLTPEEWFTFDINQDGFVNQDGVPRGQPGDVDGESDDPDPGRPTELFGTGFGPVYTAATWNEFSFYEGSDSTNDLPRDPFPFVYRDVTTQLLHVEESVRGFFNEGLSPPFCGPPDQACPFTPTPWAVGVPIGYTPGAQTVPFDVQFDVDLMLSGGLVRAYYQQCLNDGRVFATITSLKETQMFGSSTGFPSFYMKEALQVPDPPPGAKAAKLVVVLCNKGDIDCDGDRDAADVSMFVAVLLGNDGDPDHVRRSDVNGDRLVDGRDVSVFVQAYLTAP